MAMNSLLIGDNPFTGVSHLSQVAGRERTEKLRFEQIVKIIERSISCGASGFTFSTHPTNLQILSELKETEALGAEFDLFPVLPYAEGYVRVTNEKGTIGLVREVFARLPLSGKAKIIVESGLSAVRFDPVRVLKAYVDMELESYLRVKPKRSNLQGVFLHEIPTDLAIGLGARQLFDSFMQHVSEKYRAKPGFVTRNFARFVDFFRDNDLPLKEVTIMTPLNKIGFQMNPSQNECEACLSSLNEGQIIAISILAGGYVGLDEAVKYIQGLPRVAGVAVGVSSTQHAEETFTKLRTALVDRAN
jgi:hypothetical protein